MSAPADTIKSRDNPLVKRIRSLQRSSVRKRERAFFVEGIRAVEDALAAGITPEIVVVSEDFPAERIPRFTGDVPIRTMSSSLFRDVTNTVTPQGILAVVPIRPVPPGPADPPLIVVADGISDPGNLGTLLRSCAGAGVTSVYLTPDTVDPYNPKVVRSAMGAHFRTSIEPIELQGTMPFPEGTAIIVSDAESDLAYDEADMTGPTTLVVGAEATGVSNALRDSATASVSIPMAPGSESLNAGVAGSILLFEAQRQRRSLRKH